MKITPNTTYTVIIMVELSFEWNFENRMNFEKKEEEKKPLTIIIRQNERDCIYTNSMNEKQNNIRTLRLKWFFLRHPLLKNVVKSCFYGRVFFFIKG